MTYVWEALSESGTSHANETDADYYNSPREDLIALIKSAPKVVLDVGCGGGATGAAIKGRFPGAAVCGVELQPAAAEIASGRLDRVLRENVETLDLAAAGFSPASIDLVLFPDVLEHLYDPWSVLRRLRPFLTPGARVLASIPNTRNLGLIQQLAGGSWQYTAWGLLDITHIRFFTRKSIFKLFEQASLRILSLGANCEGTTASVKIPAGQTADIATPRMILKAITQEDLLELSVIQFLIEAQPV